MVCCAELHSLSSIWGVMMECLASISCRRHLPEPVHQAQNLPQLLRLFPIVQMGQVCAGNGQKSGYMWYVMSPSTEPSLWEKPQSRGAVDERQVSLRRKWTVGDLQVLILFRKNRNPLWSWTESQPQLTKSPAACSYSMMADPALIPSNAPYEAHPKTC